MAPTEVMRWRLFKGERTTLITSSPGWAGLRCGLEEACGGWGGAVVGERVVKGENVRARQR